MQLFVDMDGVVADFDQHHENLFGSRPEKRLKENNWRGARWDLVRAHPNFYASIPPMPDMRVLWDYVSRHEPTLLTGIPDGGRGERVCEEKRAWALVHLGVNNVICCRSCDKSHYCAPGDILIDDWERYRELWTLAGGTWITHTSAADTIQQLKRMGY